MFFNNLKLGVLIFSFDSKFATNEFGYDEYVLNARNSFLFLISWRGMASKDIFRVDKLFSLCSIISPLPFPK